LKNPEVIKMYREKIDHYTRDLGQVEKIKKFTLLGKEFTQEDGEITATQKIRRKIINQRYKDVIDAMYAE
jgi:long-chain acyl-CoA synthetase